MQLKETVKAKRELEKELLDRISGFERQTGLTVFSCYLTHHNPIGLPPEMQAVELDVRLPK